MSDHTVVPVWINGQVYKCPEDNIYNNHRKNTNGSEWENSGVKYKDAIYSSGFINKCKSICNNVYGIIFQVWMNYVVVLYQCFLILINNPVNG